METKAKILDLTGLSELEYETFLFNTAIEYLEDFIPGDEWGQKVLTNSPVFWKWWVQQWNKRNADFLTFNSFVDYASKKYAYLSYHAITNITVYPSKTVFQLSYDRMVQELITTETLTLKP